MSFRDVFQIDTSFQGRRWQVPILLPVLLALTLVVALAIQSARTAQMHRRAVANALRDYAAFATWQYARRASDYLRLTIGVRLAMSPAQTGMRRPLIACRLEGDRATVRRNETSAASASIDAALAVALRQADASHLLTGLVALGDAAPPRFIGYRFHRDSLDRWSGCEATIVEVADLLPVFDHVAGFAPLLPPSFVGNLPNDSLVSIQVFAARGPRIATIGSMSPGMSASDVLGPDLADLRVVATLHPAATERLVAGGMPSSTTPALVAMLIVTLALCVVAVIQVRRTQEIIRLRDDFVASVSHELKTPLTQISLFADTLALPRERSASEQRQYLTIISREATRLGQLVDGILHFAGMMRSTDAPVSREPSLLGEEIRAAVAAFEPLAKSRGVTIQTRIDGEIELALDRDAFRQLLLNLLDNAMKFGPDGQRIAISAFAGERRATICVDDEGPGVPPTEREKIFEPFVRLSAGANKTGSGIGLAVARDVVRRHGGRVWMTESPGGGARVEIQLPATSVVTSESVAVLA